MYSTAIKSSDLFKKNYLLHERVACSVCCIKDLGENYLR